MAAVAKGKVKKIQINFWGPNGIFIESTKDTKLPKIKKNNIHIDACLAKFALLVKTSAKTAPPKKKVNPLPTFPIIGPALTALMLPPRTINAPNIFVK